MNLYWIGAWIQRHDPYQRLTRVQHEILVSALTRDDTKTAKQFLIDWKIPQS